MFINEKLRIFDKMARNYEFWKTLEGTYRLNAAGSGNYHEQDFVSLMCTYTDLLNRKDRGRNAKVEVRYPYDQERPIIALSVGEKVLVERVAEMHNLRFED